MSLQPAEPEKGGTPRRGRRPFEPWRKLALIGAVILLAGSILKASLGDDFPRLLNLASLGLGWGFLAAAFGRAMVDRKAREREAERESR